MGVLSEINKAFERAKEGQTLVEQPCEEVGEFGRMSDILGVPPPDERDDPIGDVYGGSPADAAQEIVDAVGKLVASGMINGAANCSQDDFMLDMAQALEDIEEA